MDDLKTIPTTNEGHEAITPDVSEDDPPCDDKESPPTNIASLEAGDDERRAPAPAADVKAGIDKIAEDLAKLKERPKDNWDKSQIVASLLLPAVVALVGVFFSYSMKQAEIESAQRIADGNRSVAESNAKVAQADLIHSFVDELTQDDPAKRRLAIRAVVLALGENATQLLDSVAKTDPDPVVRQAASQSIAGIWRSLTPKLFSNDSNVRGETAHQLLELGSSTVAIAELIGGILDNAENTDGVLVALFLIRKFGPYPWDSIIVSGLIPQLESGLDTTNPDIRQALSLIKQQQSVGAERKTVSAGKPTTIYWSVTDRQYPEHEIGVIYKASEKVAFSVESPSGQETAAVSLGEFSQLSIGNDVVMNVNHRASPFQPDMAEFAITTVFSTDERKGIYGNWRIKVSTNSQNPVDLQIWEK